ARFAWRSGRRGPPRTSATLQRLSLHSTNEAPIHMSEQEGNKPNLAAITRVPGAMQSLILLLSINIFNYVDRQILSAVVPMIRTEYFGPDRDTGPAVKWLLGILERFLGSNPENAMIGLLAMTFMVTYMLAAPIFGMLNLRCLWI